MSIAMTGINKRSALSYSSTGAPSEPNWDLVPSKGMNTTSDEELTKKIKELAIKKANATTNEELDKLASEKEKLRVQFMSSVSPDRKTLCKQASNAIRNQKSNEVKPLEIQALLAYLNKDDEQKSMKTSQGDGSLKTIINSTGTYDYEVSSGGNTVLRSTNGKWLCSRTPQEQQKSKEFNQIFDGVYDAQKNTNSNIVIAQTELYTQVNCFDAKA